MIVDIKIPARISTKVRVFSAFMSRYSIDCPGKCEELKSAKVRTNSDKRIRFRCRRAQSPCVDAIIDTRRSTRSIFHRTPRQQGSIPSIDCPNYRETRQRSDTFLRVCSRSRSNVWHFSVAQPSDEIIGRRVRPIEMDISTWSRDRQARDRCDRDAARVAWRYCAMTFTNRS